MAAALAAVPIHHVIFTLYDPKQNFDDGITAAAATSSSSSSSAASAQEAFGQVWSRLHPTSRVLYEPDIRRALDRARGIGAEAGGMQTLITGSQHLVGGALFFLKPEAHRCQPDEDGPAQ
ncbi:hypothetical protein CDD83_6293 [Cordyceps sp. RAO-2017]|nr:hypothetical protein CDD83_6293 [Cordyceps sp. RAO-2017]